MVPYNDLNIRISTDYQHVNAVFYSSLIVSLTNSILVLVAFSILN